jgi:ABC-type multidrug transport system fused ATPase/permease subunit
MTKEKLKRHSLLSNIIYVFRPAVKKYKKSVFGFAAEIVLMVMVPIISSACTALVVSLAAGDKSLLKIILSILAAFMLYGITSSLNTFFSGSNQMAYVEIRLSEFFRQICEKNLELSLEQAESHEVREKAGKAWDSVGENNEGLENIIRRTVNFSGNVIGLVVYTMIVGLLNIKVMALIFLLGVVTAALSSCANIVRKKVMETYQKKAMVKRYIDRTARDTASGKDVRVFDMSPWLIGKYEDAAREMNRQRRIYIFAKFFCTDISGVVLSAVRDIVCYLFLISQMEKGMSVASFVFYLGLISGFAAWFTQLGEYYSEMKRDSYMVDQYREYQDIDTKMENDGLVPDNGFSEIEIEFDHVSFSYEGSTASVIDDLSFIIRKGEKIALVGLNGAGKSTLVKLMSGLYLPTSGRVLVNGIDTKEINRREYMKHVAAIFQKPFITAYSIAENIAFSEKADKNKVRDVLKKAGLYEKVQELPDGVDTCLGKEISPNGIKLSGGENQKLLLARALYRDPSLVLLDEPTAALDAIAESNIYENYEMTMKGMTTVFISHRLASTRFCNRIILLENGRIKEEGDHDTLMSAGGTYAELFNVQSKYYKEDIAV